MKKPTTEKCYKCGAAATSREHVPPQCIFPEQKDIHINYRQKLITVPSCDDHNQKKSNEDEFFMISITPCIGNNLIGLYQTRTKIKRAFEKKQPEFIEKILNGVQIISLEGESGEKHDVWLGAMDKARMDKCVELMAYGLYYHEYKKSFTGEFKIIYGFTSHEESYVKDYKYFLFEKFKFEFSNQKIHGANPKIFTYQILPQDKFGLIVLKMTFFEGSTILVLFVNKDADLNAMEEIVESVEWDSLNNLAQIMEISDNSNKLKKLNDHLTKFPPSTYYYSLKASIYQKLKQFEEAKRDYLNALVFDEKNIEALCNLGFLYDKEFDDKEEAKSCYEKVLMIEPKLSIVRLNLGVLLSSKFKDKEAAKNQYEIILSYDPNEDRAHNNLANYYRDFSDDINCQKVIFHFERAIEINSLYIEAYINYGSFLQTINQNEKSRVILQKAKKLLKEEETMSIFVDRLIEQTNT